MSNSIFNGKDLAVASISKNVATKEQNITVLILDLGN